VAAVLLLFLFAAAAAERRTQAEEGSLTMRRVRPQTLALPLPIGWHQRPLQHAENLSLSIPCE
jgi:hypothetical protein